jgi:aminoacylase
MASLSVDERAVSLFQAYLRMRTDHPSPEVGYPEAVALFRQCSEDIGLDFSTVDIVPGHPIVLLKWTGTEPSLPSVVLNSHSDVVPAVTESWTKDPYGGIIENGNIYGVS